MECSGYAQRRSDARKKRCGATNDNRRGRITGETCDFVAVPKDLMGFVIGKKGSSIKLIETESGSRITSDSDQGGFSVSGNEGQRARAKQLIYQRMEEAQTKRGRKGYPRQLVKIPSGFEKHVKGKGGDNLRNICTVTGAQVLPRGNKLFELKGTEKEVQHAELLMKRRVASARIKPDKMCCYIDDRNLSKGCELQLVPVEDEDRMVLPGSHSQYRLKPLEEYDLFRGACSRGKTVPSYQNDLIANALECLNKIKRGIESNKFHEADMWCHVGTVIIREPDEADVGETWDIQEAVDKLKKRDWRLAFKEGVLISKHLLQETFGSPKTDEDYTSRYDLTFITPQGRSLRCKVWVANQDVQAKLEEIPIPFSDIKHVVEELYFDDELTRSRCRGWLVLPSKKYLQADIIFPGCQVDCRLMIRPKTITAIELHNSGDEEVQAKVLADFLSRKLTFTVPDGLHVPKEELPAGFLFNHMRCSRRTLYEPREGFTLIISEESTWCSDVRGEQNRETTDLHLGREEWDRALSGKDWEPEMITSKLPEFLQFVYQVQDFLTTSNCNNRG